MRKLILASLALLIALGTGTAWAQTDYQTFASSTDLVDGGSAIGAADLNCFERLSDGRFVWFNEETGAEQIVIYDATAPSGSRTTVVRTATVVDSDISASAGENVDVTDCAASVASGSDLYFSLQGDRPSTGNTINWIYKTDASGTSGSVLAEFDGAQGLAVDGTTLYGIGYAFFDDTNTFQNGIYSLSTSGTGQTPSAVITDSDLSLVDIDIASNGNLYGTNNRFAGGSFTNTIVEFDITGSTVSVLAEPYASGSPFTKPSDTGDSQSLGTIEVESLSSADRIYFYNNSFNGPDGEEIGLYQIDGTGAQIIATQADLAADADVVSTTDIGSDTPERLYLDPSTGDLFFANNSGNFGDTDAIIQLTSVPLPVELATFDGRFTGEGIALSWQTLSETSNAGFELQHMAPNASSFASAGFVEGNGTTNQVSDYSFFLNTAQAGTHTFRLLQVDVDGDETLSAPITVEVMGDPVALTGPNPATPGAQVEVLVKMDASQNVDIAVYNLLGQKVATIYNGPAAKDQTLRNAVDVSSLASGVYFVRVLGETMSATEKLSIVK